ncbi:MAG TPA: cation transporter [Gammaproteobacteria bacterium]|nr:cation transporter [Gammaproteobacteria bacterium]
MPEDHTHPHGDDKRLLWALTLTGGFMVAEVIGGVMSNSLALLADAGHMLTDTVSLFLAWLAARLSRKPADKLRSYGYHRMQILAAFLNGTAFILIVIWIGYEAVQRFIDPPQVNALIMMPIAVLGLLVNIAAFAILHSGDHENLNIKAAVLHVIGDLLGSVAAITAGVIIYYTGWMPIDPILSVLVALLILRSAWFVIKQSSHILLEGTPDDVDVSNLKKVLSEAVPGVIDVHHVHLWSLTPKRPIITMHVLIEKNCQYTAVLENLKQVLKNNYGIEHSTVQIEMDGNCVDDPVKQGRNK